MNYPTSSLARMTVADFARASCSLLLVLAVLAVPVSASAANRYWVGTPGGEWTNTDNWATAANDCGVGGGASVPGSADVAYFVSNCTNDVSINPATTVSGINIGAGYTGTGTLHTNVTLTTFTQADGSLILNGQPLTLNGAVTISGGTFMAGTGTVILGGGAATIDVSNEITFENLRIDAAGVTKTIAASDTIIVTGTLTLQDGLLSQSTVSASGTILAQGDIVQESTFDGGTAQIVIAGTGNQLFTGNAQRTIGLLPRIKIEKPSGTLTLSGTIRVTSATTTAWIYIQGDIDPSTNASIVIFAANGNMTITGSHALHHVIFDTNTTSNRIHTIAASTTLTVLGDLTIDNSSTAIITLNTGTIDVNGNLWFPDTINHTGTATIRINGIGDQTMTGYATDTGGGLPAIEINKLTGTLTLSGTLRTAQNWTYTAGDLDAGTSTVVFVSALTISGSHSLNNVVFNGPITNTAHAIFHLTADSLVTVKGTLSLVKGSLYNGTLRLEGDLIHEATFGGGTGLIEIVGTKTRTINLVTDGRLPALTLDGENVIVHGPENGSLHIMGTYTQRAGAFVCGRGTLHAHNIVFLSGTFDPGSGRVVLSASRDEIFIPPPVFNHLQLDDVIEGHWDFATGMGGTAFDISENGANGLLLGEMTATGWTSSTPPLQYANPYALMFDGVDDRVFVEGFNWLKPNQPVSVAFWANVRSSASGTNISLFSIDNGVRDDLSRFSLSPWNNKLLWYYGHINKDVVLPSFNSYFDKWVHLAMISEGKSVHNAWTQGKMRLYVNGKMVASREDGSDAPRLELSNLSIGGGILTGLSYAPTSIDDFRIYSRILSESEIESLASGTQRTNIAYILAGPLNVSGTLMVDGMLLDVSQNAHSITYGAFGSRRGGDIDFRVLPISISPPPPGGGRGSRSPGRGGDAPLIDTTTRRLLPNQPDTVSPLYRTTRTSVPPAPAGVSSPMRERLALRIEKRIAEYPRLRTMLLKMLERLDRRLAARNG